MKVKYDIVDFDRPVFSQGKNFGTKVEAKKHGCELYHDTELPWVKIVMIYKGHTTHFGEFHSADIAKEVIAKKEPIAIADEMNAPRRVIINKPTIMKAESQEKQGE